MSMRRRALAPHRPSPAHGVFDLGFEAAQGRPAELAVSLLDISHQARRIAGPAGAVDVGHRSADRAADRFDDLLDAVAGARAEVEGAMAAAARLLAEQPA